MDPSTPAGVSSRVWTVPNLLSMLRLALVPVFLVLVLLERDLLALMVLIFSVLTDYLDGVIARRFGQVTRLGQLIDPAADRLFIFATILGLAFRDVIPWWLFLVILGRDVFLLVLGITLANAGFGPLPVHHLGKVATFCLFYALPLLMLGRAVPSSAFLADPLGWAFVVWGAFLYWWAGIIYAIETIRVIRLPRGAAGPASDSLNR